MEEEGKRSKLKPCRHCLVRKEEGKEMANRPKKGMISRRGIPKYLHKELTWTKG